jgi:PH (Pleckstrin Homology) domain-containing protein/putative oligomerization/nucleic acid binding protein
MSYADGLLSTGERITYRQKQHPFIFIWGARYAILALIVAIVAIWFGGNLSTDGIGGSVRTILGWITVILFVGGIAVAIWTGLRYINQEYVLTNRRVLQVEGVLNRNSTDSSLEKINDAVLSQSIFGRMFDFGDLTVLTASESGIDKMKMLRGPIAFKKAMLDAKHEAEVDMERAGWAPAPPIRDGGAAGGPGGPAPAGAAVAASGSDSPTGNVATVSGSAQATPAPAPARADPDEVTRTLASLADLRDRGAITAEEYDRKKADLLSRL